MVPPNLPVDCTCDEHCPHAEDAANNAVRKVFAILGVNIDVPKEVADFQQNLQFGATLRKATDHGLLAVTAVIATAICAAIWVGITQGFRVK